MKLSTRAGPPIIVEVGRALNRAGDVADHALARPLRNLPDGSRGICRSTRPSGHRRGKSPTWYRPPASQASAISLHLARIGSKASDSSSGGLASGAPFWSATEDGGQVEAEAVDVVLGGPVAQAIEHHVADDRVVAVERVAAVPLKL